MEALPPVAPAPGGGAAPRDTLQRQWGVDGGADAGCRARPPGVAFLGVLEAGCLKGQEFIGERSVPGFHLGSGAAGHLQDTGEGEESRRGWESGW